jgi:enamine deaminase RidA (YjgF/YER057c/UK114 family)
MTEKNHIQRINPPELGDPQHYSHAVIVEAAKTVYIAGQVPLDKDGNLVGAGDFASQVRQTFENLKLALAGSGASFTDLVSMNIYVTDAFDVNSFIEIRRHYIPNHLSAATLVKVKELFRPDVLIEIGAVAAIGAVHT